MSKTPTEDMIIILPGILGSVLQKHEKDLWAVSEQSIWSALTNHKQALADITLNGDSAEDLHLDDGIQAARLMGDSQIIPGLIKVDGYSLLNRLVIDNFEVTFGDFYNDSTNKTANFYHFPYDWRRDCRANARILKTLLEKRLRHWREASGAADAKVIFLGHSMSGLVACYYIEVLGGWQDTRSLVTFGTPYRGVFKSINFLANGYKQLFLDFTDAICSFTSIYQLLPIYPAFKVDGNYQRVAETADLPNIDQQKALSALQFHREIEAAVKKNQQDEQYLSQFCTLPIVRVGQPTMQSAEWNNGKVTVSRGLPAVLSGQLSLGDGDGTVPQVSAIPIEQSQKSNAFFVAETHSVIHYRQQALQDLLRKVATDQFDASEVRKPQAFIRLAIDDSYLPDEAIALTAKVTSTQPVQSMLAHIEPVNRAGMPTTTRFTQRSDSDWSVTTLDPLPNGIYRVSVQDQEKHISSVHSLFEVVNKGL